MTTMTVYEAADQLGLTHKYVRKLVELGRIKAKKHGRDWVVSKASVVAFKRTPRPLGRPKKS